MQDNIFIPKTLKIGFQKREDTFTKKLAYVIYYDEKNKLRKEQSWNTWRDKKIDPQEFDNIPTSGFVLNKKVGGCKYDWNVRNTYVRVFDPRGFEFEISIPNLLFILENSNSIKGKGLEGDFVYGWAGAELLLVPTSSPDYVQLAKLNDLRHNKTHIKSKDLIIGATYLHKSNEKMIYMGRFKKFKYERWSSSQPTKDSLGEHFFFLQLNKPAVDDDNDDNDVDNIKTFKSLNDYFIEVIDSNCVNNFAHLMDKIEKSPIYCPIDESKTEYVEYTEAEAYRLFKKNYFYFFTFDTHHSITGRTENGKFMCWNYGNSGKGNWTFDSIKQLMDKFKPCYKKTYLANGKLFQSTKKGEDY